MVFYLSGLGLNHHKVYVRVSGKSECISSLNGTFTITIDNGTPKDIATVMNTSTAF